MIKSLHPRILENLQYSMIGNNDTDSVHKSQASLKHHLILFLKLSYAEKLICVVAVYLLKGKMTIDMKWSLYVQHGPVLSYLLSGCLKIESVIPK